MTDDELKALVARTAANIDRLEISQAKTDAQLAKTDAQLAKTDAQLARTVAKVDEIGRQLAEIGHSNGDAAENFFYSALAEDKRLGAVRFDEISRNLKMKRHRVQDEFDIFLENGDAVALIEVKYKVKPEHIETLTTRKVENFRILSPDYAHYKIYTGIAGLSFEPKAEEIARAAGVVILKQQGQHVEMFAAEMRAY